MKTIPVGLATQYASNASTLCHCLQVTRSDGVVLGFTTANKTLTISGVDYVPGFSVSDLVSTATLGVDNLELTIIPDTDVPEADLASGLWDNAWFYLFECNWKDTSVGVLGTKRGQTGEVRIANGAYVLEFRGLSQLLQQTIGLLTSKTCRAHFADYPRQALSARCGVDHTAWTVTGSVTAVASRQQLTDSTRAEADDWFKEGYFKFTSGLNAGAAYAKKVKTFVAGVFTFALPFPFTVSVSDTFEVTAGCQKRFTEDCLGKFTNQLNFQGEPHLPGQDVLLAPPAGLQ